MFKLGMQQGTFKSMIGNKGTTMVIYPLSPLGPITKREASMGIQRDMLTHIDVSRRWRKQGMILAPNRKELGYMDIP